jgi:hypothetical protein
MMQIRTQDSGVQKFRNWESRRAKVGSIILAPDS